MATDEGSFHGGDASAPPPLDLFIEGLTGCIMTQIRAFAKCLKVQIDDLQVDRRIIWQWTPNGYIYETVPKSFDIDTVDQPDDGPLRAHVPDYPCESVLERVSTTPIDAFYSIAKIRKACVPAGIVFASMRVSWHSL